MSGDLARALGREPPIWVLELVQPLLDRLGPDWMQESEALEGLNYPNMRAFWAVEYGLAARRRRGIFNRRWWIKLTKKGWEHEG